MKRLFQSCFSIVPFFSVRRQPIVPVITVTAETTLHRTIDGESFQKTVGAGPWELSEFELRQWDNTVSITGEGVEPFVYRMGRL